MKWFVGFLVFIVCSVALAQENKKLPINLSFQCDEDTVGLRVAYKIREGVRRSSSMRIADSYSDSLIQMSLVCLNPDTGESGNVSYYSYAITFVNRNGYYDYQLRHGVGTCGRLRVDECAGNIVATIDNEIDRLKQHIIDGSFNPS